MLKIVQSNKFKKDLKLARKRNLNLEELKVVVNKLANQEQLDEKDHDHALSGCFSDFRECYIKPDWLLIYKYVDDRLVLVLFAIGSHSELFNK